MPLSQDSPPNDILKPYYYSFSVALLVILYIMYILSTPSLWYSSISSIMDYITCWIL